MGKPITATAALKALGKAEHYLERAENARLRSRWHPGTETAKKERAVASRWDDKAQTQLEIVRTYLRSQGAVDDESSNTTRGYSFLFK